MLRLGNDPEKLYRATFICQDGLCCCNMALDFLFDSFVKIWATCEMFLGKWFSATPPPPPPPPPLAKNFPYAYERQPQQTHAFFQTLPRLCQLGQIVNRRFAYQTYCFLTLEVLLAFAVDVDVAKLSSQVCPYKVSLSRLFPAFCISQNLILLTYNLFCFNNKGGA